MTALASPIHARLHDIELGGRRYRYADTGGSGPVLVFLHGFTDSRRSFDALVPALAQKARLLLLDQRGHGESDPADRYAVRDFAADAVLFIEATARQPVHLIGHSLGSIVAQRVAALRPALIASLILIGAAPTAAGHPGLLALKEELAAPGSTIDRDFAAEFQRGTIHRPIDAAQLEVFVTESLKLHPSTWRLTLEGLLTEDASEAQAPSQLPVLSIWGERDAVFDAASQTALAKTWNALRAVHYPDVGHAPHWEVPDRVSANILDFLKNPHAQHISHQDQELAHAAG